MTGWSGGCAWSRNTCARITPKKTVWSWRFASFRAARDALARMAKASRFEAGFAVFQRRYYFEADAAERLGSDQAGRSHRGWHFVRVADTADQFGKAAAQHGAFGDAAAIAAARRIK